MCAHTAAASVQGREGDFEAAIPAAEAVAAAGITQSNTVRGRSVDSTKSLSTPVP